VAWAGRLRGGPAKIAVVSSGLMGMISGSSIANVVTTGTFTIPMMKRIGYRPEFAGAVEAAASTGGQLMPPVMGAAAFIMAEFTQTPYVTIIIMAAIPALLYYLSIYMNVHYEACRTGMKGLPESEIPKASDVLKAGWHYTLPVAALVVILTLGYSPARSAFVAMAILIATSMIRASTRMGVKDFWEVLSSAGKGAVGIVAACACAGMIVGITSMTGLGVKLAMLIETLAGGSLLVALLLTAIASLILGMALPTTPNYIVQASVAAPALIALGVPKLTAHMFVFYFGVYADITPPVALAAYTAAGIAKGDPMITGWIASRNVIVGFIVPFLFVFYPGLVMQGPVLDILIISIATAFGVIAYSAGVGNYLFRKCNAWERAGLFISGILLIMPGLVSDLVGLAILAAIYFRQRLSVNNRPEPVV
jgi:TRAP transporter 4TM/12TM fusion protein